MASLYIHIPFCLSKCHYCAFDSCVAGEDIYRQYSGALTSELAHLVKRTIEQNIDTELNTLFIGGGTPTCLPRELLQGIIQNVFALFKMAPNVEISVEANPGTVDVQYLEMLLETGVNRLSLGVQSFNNLELERVGRIHDEKGACSAIEAARTAGFDNINLDLMYGLPGQTPQSWRDSLEKGLSFVPEHLSLYQLTVEPDTLFNSLYENNTLRHPSEQEIFQMDKITKELCTSAGLHQYEISNYAFEGKECRHNINYWLNNDYLAAGTSAVSCLDGLRERRIADPIEYIRLINRNKSVVIEKECLSREASFRESVIMGLRMVQGVSRKALFERYSLDPKEYYGSTLNKLIEGGFLELTETHLRMTEKGWPLSNQIMSELV
jgi:oxygen-independent coproporphyrinogen-3 oxidase